MESYAHGQFSWVDLMTTDMDGASGFYRQVFGWDRQDQDTQGGPPYAMWHMGDAAVGGMGEIGAEMQAAGMPPVWNSYVTVDDAEAVTARVEGLGGKVTMPVMQIMDAGWMAFLADPEGAQFAIWQKNTHPGSGICNEPGSLCWNELATRDVDRACEFYGALLGWTFNDMPNAHTRYVAAHVGEGMNAGIMQMDEEWGDMPSHWMVYFATDDADAASERVTQAGGKVCHGPFDIPVGRMAVLNDPQGAVFSIIRLARSY